MAKNRKNKTSATQIANSSQRKAPQLELPEGYTTPSKAASTSKKNKRGRGRGSAAMSQPSAYLNVQAAPGSHPSPPPTPPSSRQLRRDAATKRLDLKPWVYDPKNYAPPDNNDNLLNFNYTREWVSLGKAPKQEFSREITRGKRMQLPHMFPDNTKKEASAMRPQYEAAGEIARGRVIFNRLWKINHHHEADPPCPFKLWGSRAEGTVISGAHHGNETSSLVVLLGLPELGEMVLSYLNPSVRDISALALTCKRLSQQVSSLVAFWDIHTPTAEFDNYVNTQAEKFRTKMDKSGQVIQSEGVRTRILVMTRIRGQAQDAQHPYSESFIKSLQLFRAISSIPRSFKHVVFDQLQFFDTRMFEVMVASLPNLETVSISRCELMDVTKLPELIRIIKHSGAKRLSRSNNVDSSNPGNATDSATSDLPNNVPNSWPTENSTSTGSPSAAAQASTNARTQSLSRHGTLGTPAWQEALAEGQMPEKKEVKDYIRLDFAPYYFSGPETKSRLGSYGVTYNEPTFHTPKAATALTLRCGADAEEIGMDLWSDSSSYFSFLKRLPGSDPLWAIKVREAVVTLKIQMSGLSRVDEVQASKMNDQFADDVMAAVSGDNFNPYPGELHRIMKQAVGENRHTEHWWRNPVTCQVCHHGYLRAFFPIKTGRCWACHMIEFISDIEDSHARRYQLCTLELLFNGLRADEITLTRLLSHAQRRVILDRVRESTRLADKAWKYFKFEVPVSQRSGSFLQEEPVLPQQPPLAMNTSTPGLSNTAIAMSHWCWARTALKQRFDYLKGGPQRQHPCLIAANYASGDVGARSLETFSNGWFWTPVTEQAYREHLLNVAVRENRGYDHTENINCQIRHAMRNLADLGLRRFIMGIEYAYSCKLENAEFRWYKNRIEDGLRSLMTPGQLPFNHDQPIPNPRLEPERFKAVIDKHSENELAYRAHNHFGAW